MINVLFKFFHNRSHLELEIFRQLQIQRQVGSENDTTRACENGTELGKH